MRNAAKLITICGRSENMRDRMKRRRMTVAQQQQIKMTIVPRLLRHFRVTRLRNGQCDFIGLFPDTYPRYPQQQQQQQQKQQTSDRYTTVEKRKQIRSIHTSPIFLTRKRFQTQSHVLWKTKVYIFEKKESKQNRHVIFVFPAFPHLSTLMPKTPTLLLPSLSMDDADVPEWALDDSEEHDGIDQELLASAMILENEHGKIDSGIDEPLDNEDGLAQNNADWQTCQQGSYEQTGANNKFIDDNKNQQASEATQRMCDMYGNVKQQGNQNETPREQQRRQQQVDENRRLCSNALTAQLEIEEYLKEFAQNMINAVQTSIDCIR